MRRLPLTKSDLNTQKYIYCNDPRSRASSIASTGFFYPYLPFLCI